MNIKERHFLQGLRKAAENYGKQVPNPHWKWAYTELAKAADHCDAILARCTNVANVERGDDDPGVTVETER